MRWGLGLAARLYPKAWRERYGVEFACLLEDVEPRWTDVVDVLRGAVVMQVRAWSSYLKLVGAVTVAGVIVAMGVSFTIPSEYVSSAVIEGTAALDHADRPEALDRINEVWQDVVSRRSLSELIQRPDLELYRAEREIKPVEDVIEDMHEALHIEILDGASWAFRVSFTYPDRHKAQLVIHAITEKVIDMDRTRRIIDSASLPKAPVKPDRLAFVLWGLGVGLLSGVVASFLRWRAKWTIEVIGSGLAGCAIAASVSLLLPDRYTSTGLLRVERAPAADGVRRYLTEAEMSDWMREEENLVLDDGGLAQFIKRPSLLLYDIDPDRQSMAPVIARLRKNLSVVKESKGRVKFSFTYGDSKKAQAMVSAVMTMFEDVERVHYMTYCPAKPPVGSDCSMMTGFAYGDCLARHAPQWEGVRHFLNPRLLEALPGGNSSAICSEIKTIQVLDPASLPETPDGPDRRIPAGAGLAAGVFVGTYALRKKIDRPAAPRLSHT